MRVGALGFWWRDIGGPPAARPPLPGPTQADVAIVGAGFTGLWTAYYLKRAEPSLRVIVLEAEHAGFGASGRNGGWLSGFFSGPARAYERRRPAGSYLALQRAMFDTVGEVAAVLDRHGIDAELIMGGRADGGPRPRAAHAPARGARSGASARDRRGATCASWARRSSPSALRVDGALGASFSPHAARVHPAKLLVGLAGAAEALGVEIYEHTPVSAIAPHRAQTARGSVEARWIVRAIEGYTASLRGERRALVPMNSSMIVTEPLGSDPWRQIGWEGREVLGDDAHVYAYLQRTADGRIAIGGRGVPYRFGSRTDGRGATAPRTIAQLRAKLAAMFPAAAGAEIDHAWSGVLGVPRDWCPSVGADSRTGLAHAGGYVGEGVAASNLAARTLRDLLARRAHGAHGAAVGRPPGAALGARAAALGRDPRRLRAVPPRRRRRAAHAAGPRASAHCVDALSGRE